jgi:dihydropteroate synthase
LDAGIGFGKTARHNLQLLRALDAFKKWNRPLLLGVSRKSFIGRVTGGEEIAARLPGSLAAACWGVEHGVNILRVHDVAATRQAIAMTEAILSIKK